MRHQCLQLAFARSFLSALDHEFERFGYLNTLSSKSLDIPFFNCSILPERSFAFRITSDLLRPLLPPFLFLYIPSFDRFLLVWGFRPHTTVLYHPRLFSLFAHSLRSSRRYRRSILTAAPPPHWYRVTGNEWHNHPWLVLWSRYIAVGFHIANNAFNTIA